MGRPPYGLPATLHQVRCRPVAWALSALSSACPAPVAFHFRELQHGVRHSITGLTGEPAEAGRGLFGGPVRRCIDSDRRWRVHPKARQRGAGERPGGSAPTDLGEAVHDRPAQPGDGRARIRAHRPEPVPAALPTGRFASAGRTTVLRLGCRGRFNSRQVGRHGSCGPRLAGVRIWASGHDRVVWSQPHSSDRPAGKATLRRLSVQ